MAGKEESEVVQFIKERALVMEAESTMSTRSSNGNRFFLPLKANFVYL